MARKKPNAAFQTQVAWEAAKAIKTFHELASE